MRSILTVDDSASVRQMVKFALTSAGYQVREAENGRAALAVIADNRFDMILTDLNMPELNGIELIRALRAIPSYKGTPIVFLTTESAPELKQTAKDAGATGWLVKPFNKDQLLAVAKKFVP